MKLSALTAVQDRCLRVYFPTIGNNLQHLIQPVNTFADSFCNEFHGWVGAGLSRLSVGGKSDRRNRHDKLIRIFNYACRGSLRLNL